VKLATPAVVIVPAGVQVVAVCVKVEPTGNLSLVETLNVPGWPGWPVLASFTASITGVVTVLVQLAPAGQLGSPPPVTVAVLALGLAAEAATVTGTVTTMLPVAAPAAIEQPAKLVAPEAGQPLIVPPVAVIAPLVVMPLGKVSAIVIAAVVGPFATAIVIV
jgi:hypothetical protein